MFALNHLILKTLRSESKAPGSSNVETLAKTGDNKNQTFRSNSSHFSVLSRADKEFISTSEKEVKSQIQIVMRFMYRGKADVIGAFKETSKSKSPVRSSAGGTPSYYKELEKLLKKRTEKCAVIVSVIKDKFRSYYKSDLILSSNDLNVCDFSLLLGTCLAEQYSNIYIEVDDLTSRGLKRLVGMVKEVKNIFNSNVCVFLISTGCSLNSELAQLSECELGQSELVEPLKKKYKSEEDNNSLYEDMKSLKSDNEKHARDLDIIQKKYERLQEDHIQLQIDHGRVVKENEAAQKMSVEIETVKSELENLKSVNAKLKDDRDNWKKNSDCLSENNFSLKKDLEDSNIEQENLKNLNDISNKDCESFKDKFEVSENDNINLNENCDRLVVKLEDMKEKFDISVKDHEILKTSLEKDRDSLQTDFDCLKKTNEDLLYNYEKVQLKIKSLEDNHRESDTSEESKKGGIKSLKDTLVSIRERFVKASAPEIVSRSIPRLHCNVNIFNTTDKKVKYEVKILKGEVVEDFAELLEFEGTGVSVKKAKINAYEKFINKVETYHEERKEIN